MPPTVVELFAGTGGAALGLERAGFLHLSCVERNKEAAETLRQAGFPAVCAEVADFVKEYESQYQPPKPRPDAQIDLVWSSFPCVGWSTAGKRLKSKEDDGWRLTVEAIDRVKPKWFIGENVAALQHHSSGCEDGCLGPVDCAAAFLDLVIIADLKKRFKGVQALVLDGSRFGLCQDRKRLFIVAGPERITWPRPTHGKSTSQVDLFGATFAPFVNLDDHAWDYLDKCLCCEDWVCLACNMHAGECGCLPPLDWPNVKAPTVTTADCQGLGSKKARDAWEKITGRRFLTRSEALAAQGLPFTHPINAETGSAWWLQVGNAVPPILAEVVGRAVLAADGGRT
jgi:site-specific DNA-cytosine methylase